MEGGRNRRGQRQHPGKHWMHPGKHWPNQQPTSKQVRFLDIAELAVADLRDVMEIVKTCRMFKVDADKWECDQKGGKSSRTMHLPVPLLLPQTPIPASVSEAPCDSHFDPQSGYMCTKRARCFPTNVQIGAAETVKQRMDGVATKLFVQQNLVDAERLWTFLHVFNAAATNVIKRLCNARSLEYGKDVVFSFKGGNVMRLVLLDFLDKLTSTAREEWDDMMQIGDMDFEVFIDDATDLMVRDTAILMMYVIYSFRAYLEREGWVIRPDPEAILAMSVVVPAITSMITEGHKVHTEDNITVPYALQEGCDLLFVPVRSVLMVQQDKRDKAQWLDTGARADSALNISLNTSVSVGVVHKDGVAPEADIVLLRIKHGLRVVVTDKCYRRATAEVVDVSIPTNMDRMHRIKSEDKSVQWFTLYDFDIGGRMIKIHAPSINNFVLDLHMFMFVLSEFPWYDPKQAKRMKRYFWFCTILRSQQGASAAAIEAELASVSRVLLTLLSKTTKSGMEVIPKTSKASSLARRTSPWTELLQQVELTYVKAHDAGKGAKDWTKFVKDMRATAMAVRLSYASLVSLSSPLSLHSPAAKQVSSVLLSKRAALATLAMAAISASHALSKATVPLLPS